MKKFFGILAAVMMLATSVAQAGVIQTVDFSGPVATGSSQAPNVWYTDRYAPAGFQVSGSQLHLTVDETGAAANRGGAYSSTFYDTQGRKYDLQPEVTAVSVDMYIAQEFASANQRIGGLWGTAFTASDMIAGVYPILEFASDGGVARFQGWDAATGWKNYGLPSGFSYDTMYTLGFALNDGMVDYLLNGELLGSVNAFGGEYLGNAMLQGINKFQVGGDFDSRTIVFDNLVASNSVPEPASLALASLACAGVFFVRRRNDKKSPE